MWIWNVQHVDKHRIPIQGGPGHTQAFVTKATKTKNKQKLAPCSRSGRHFERKTKGQFWQRFVCGQRGFARLVDIQRQVSRWENWAKFSSCPLLPLLPLPHTPLLLSLCSFAVGHFWKLYVRTSALEARALPLFWRCASNFSQDRSAAGPSSLPPPLRGPNTWRWKNCTHAFLYL